MRNDKPQFWFTSDLFAVDPTEDEQTNPFCYGKELAEWVLTKSAALGYGTERVIPEDWGWCAMLRRSPYMLWIGCGCVVSELREAISPDQKAKYIPKGDELTWTCFVGTDVPFWTPFFWKQIIGRASTADDVSRLGKELESILREEPRIQLTELART